jgi:hypothetical protein
MHNHINPPIQPPIQPIFSPFLLIFTFPHNHSLSGRFARLQYPIFPGGGRGQKTIPAPFLLKGGMCVNNVQNLPASFNPQPSQRERHNFMTVPLYDLTSIIVRSRVY